MKVSKAIKYLTEWFEPNEDIIINWFEQDDFFYIKDKPVDDRVWKESCDRSDENEYIFDSEMAQIIIEDVMREDEE